MRTRQSAQAARLEHPIGAPVICAETALHDRHAVSEHAIIMAQSERGWRWQVIDQNGVSVARGLCADQTDAMNSARRAIDVCA